MSVSKDNCVLYDHIIKDKKVIIIFSYFHSIPGSVCVPTNDVEARGVLAE